MPEPTQPTLSIPRDVIEPIINAHVNTALLAALGDGSDLMRKAISAVLFTQVDPSSGQVSNYTRSDSPTRIEYMVKDAIQKAAQEAILEAVATQKQAIKKAIAESLTKKNSPVLKQLAETLLHAITKSETLQYRLNVSVETK